MTRNSLQTAVLTVDQLELAAHRVHDYDSFGRAVLNHVFREAVQKEAVIDGVARVPLEVVLKPGPTLGRDPQGRTVCIDACIGPVCIHVFVE